MTIPTGFTVSRAAWACHYHRETLEAIEWPGGGSTDFGGFWGVKDNDALFGDRSAYGWCKRQVEWGADWLEKANFVDASGETIGIAIQVPHRAPLPLDIVRRFPRPLSPRQSGRAVRPLGAGLCQCAQLGKDSRRPHQPALLCRGEGPPRRRPRGRDGGGPRVGGGHVPRR